MSLLNEETPTAKQINNIYIVDPNPPGMGVPPTEDMFIYVKFVAHNRGRSSYLGDDPTGNPIIKNVGTAGEINFIATETSFNEEGELDPEVQKTYATTNYTNIGGLPKTDSRGILEGFGVKSIDIKYNASLVPQVDITFTDTRGSALFDVIGDNNRKSPYSIFFKMPYPVFTLSIKGYFGKTVDYCLHMINWTSNFDGTTGNFDISANFVGFQQAFLADMVLGNIIGAINTQKGYENLMNIFNEDEGNSIGDDISFEQIKKGEQLNIRKIDDFFVRISKLQIESEIIKDNSDNFSGLKILNTLLNKLNRLQKFIGTPIRKKATSSKDDGTNTVINVNLSLAGVSNFIGPQLPEKKTTKYEKQTNDPKDIATDEILDNTLKLGKNYLSIRDYLLINSINTGAIERYFKTLSTIIVDYKKYYSSSLKESEDFRVGENDKVIDGPAEDSFIDLFPFTEGAADGIDFKSFLALDNKKNEPITLDLVFDFFSIEGGILNKHYSGDGLGSTNPNSTFNPKIFDAASDPPVDGEENRALYKDDMLLDSLVWALNFTEIRGKTTAKIKELEEKIKIKREEVQEELNEKLKKSLGFEPTIATVFGIICNNTQAMISTIYDISRDAENPGKKKQRNRKLEGYVTDIPGGNVKADSSEDTDFPSFGWPRIYQHEEGKGTTEIYIGEVRGITETLFPEYKFVEDVFNNLVSKRKQLEEITRATNLKNGLDTDNWYPINIIDFKRNPFLVFNNYNTADEIELELAKQLFTRSAILKTYSQYTRKTGGNITDYAQLDGINANKTIFSTVVRNVILIKLEAYKGNIPILNKDGVTVNALDNLVKIAISNNIIKEEGNNYVLNESNSLPEMGNIKMSGKRSDDATYILFDESNIINNSQKLWPDVINSKAYENINGLNPDYKKVNEKFYSSKYYNNNYMSNVFNNVWLPEVCTNLNKFNSEHKTKSNSQFLIKNNPLDIDIAPEAGEGKYINILNPYKDENEDAPYPFKYLTDTNFYKNQNKFAKSILLLSTIPFTTFNQGVLKTFESPKSKNCRILNIPKYYIYFIGGLLWRNSQPTDPIIWDLYPKLKTTQDYYITKLGANMSSDDIKIEKALIELPSNTKDALINEFLNFIQTGIFDGFEKSVIAYKSNNATNVGKKSFGVSNIYTSMILPAPMIFFPDDTSDINLRNGILISKEDFGDYLDSFTDQFILINRDNKKDKDITAEQLKKQTGNVLKVKLGIYNYFKNINDKWVASTKKTFNACSSNQNSNLIDYFRFIDRGWSDIGDKAVINLNSMLSLGNNLDTSIYFYMAKILRDSNFLFQILPNFIDYKSKEEVKKMFIPITNVNDQSAGGPIYACIYIGGASEVLDIGEENRYPFKNDGFDFGNDITSNKGGTGIPSDINKEESAIEKKDKTSLVAFKVAFGNQNQTIFKNVSLSQQEHRETGEYFRALTDLIDKRGGTQRSYQGTDLLRLFKTRSYSCKVEALGCMNIQPLMYFDLQNVPFFNGAYLITSVNHNISANHMTTSFTGLRQSKFVTSFVEDITLWLDIDLTETSTQPPLPFTNLKFTNQIYSIGVEDPNGTFTGTIDAAFFKEFGAPDEIDDTIVSTFNANIKTAGIVSNAQVTMFISNVIHNSSGLKEKERVWAVDKSQLFNYTVWERNSDGTIKKVTDNSVTPPVDLPVAQQYQPSNDIKYTPPGDSIQNDLQVDATVILKGKSTIASSFGNTEPGDGYRYRHRGYLYVVGKTQYNELLKADSSLDQYYDYPNTIGDDSIAAFSVAIAVWTKLKNKTTGKTCNVYASKPTTKGVNPDSSGSPTNYINTLNLCQPLTQSPEKPFQIFEKVLRKFGLETYENVV